MFKGIDNIFNRYRQKNEQENNKRKLQIIQQANIILADRKWQNIIRQFPTQLNLPTDHYASHCQQLINNFVEFTQLLPETRNNYYTGPGGFIDHALARTSTALSLCRDYFLAGKPESASLSEAQTQWAYAVFSAALLQGIGKIAIDLNVEIYDKDRQSLESWWPFSGAMGAKGTYYTYDFTPADAENDQLKKQVTPLLAQQLMPIEGFKQIVSNKEIFALWLALLIENDDIEGGGVIFRKILVRADTRVIREWQKALMTSARYFSPAATEPTEEAQQQLAHDLEQEFNEWLKDTLDADKKDQAKASVINAGGRESLIVNISGLGVVVTTGLFRQFLMSQPHFNTFGEGYLLSIAREFLTAQDIYSDSGEKITVYALNDQAKALPRKVQVNDSGTVKTIVAANLDQYTSPEYSVMPSHTLSHRR